MMELETRVANSLQQVGHAILDIPIHNESYIITLPSLHIEGLLTGAPYVELNKSSYIVSSAGYTARIDYTGKGWLSGKKNSFTATLTKTDAPYDVLYTADGQWTNSFCIRNKNKKQIDSWDPATTKLPPLTVKPLDSQGPLESRKAWSKVAEAIKKGDMETTQHEKSIIENRQREMRKKEREEGKEWERRYFERVESSPIFDELAKHVDEVAEADKTDGVWVWKGTQEKK
jgi:oxysterol-binding protein-related protein 9/10/11